MLFPGALVYQGAVKQTLEGLINHITRLRELLASGQSLTEAEAAYLKAELDALLGDLELYRRRTRDSH